MDRRTAKPDVDLEVVLFRGPERIFTGRPIPLAAPEGSPMDAIPAAGRIELPPTLPPGDYAVEMIAEDHLQVPKLNRAEQWMDFITISRPPVQIAAISAGTFDDW